MKFSLFILTLFCLVTSNSQENKQYKRTKTEKVYVFQDGKEVEITEENQIVKITRNEFSIRMFCKAYIPENDEFNSVQVVVYTEREWFDKLEEGLVCDNIPCLTPGTGGAAHRKNGYESIYPCNGNGGHHYLMYTDEENKRLTLLDNFSDELKLEFPIYSITIDDHVFEFKNVPIGHIYFAVFIDRNNNEVIDENELTKLIVSFVEE